MNSILDEIYYSKVQNYNSPNQIIDTIYEKINLFQEIVPASKRMKISDEGSIISWLISKVDNWENEVDKNIVKTTLVIVISSAINTKHTNHFQVQNRQFSSFAINLLKHVQLSINLNNEIPIWEREAFDSLNEAASEADFVRIAQFISRFDRSLPFDISIMHYVCFLIKYDIDSFIEILEQNNNILTLKAFLNCVDDEYVLVVLASKSNNPLVHFLVIFSVLDKIKDINFCQCEIQEILKKISLDKERFGKFIKVFFNIPLLQNAYAILLANSKSKELIDIYLKNIRPEFYNENIRITLSRFFRAFESIAEKSLCTYMWERAHHVWTMWNFGLNGKKNLFQLSISNIDYAVVSYYLSCIQSKECEALIEDIKTSIKDIPNQWFEDISAMHTEVYRLHSLMQPCIHSQLLYNGTQCKGDVESYLFDKMDNLVKDEEYSFLFLLD